MPANHEVTITLGTPSRLDADCAQCGWADVWQVQGHTISVEGVNTVLVATMCARCNAGRP